tara:strand:- start:17264 stop:18073 length:810 start_codon:yes stop_codon:yes gene_type:complete
MLYLFSIILGTSFGSFLNVCRYRIPRNESIIYPSSYCRECFAQIKWYFNIPILSWLWLKGSCYSCKAKINISYLVLEILTPILFVFNLFSYSIFSDNFLINLVGINILTLYFILISFIDFATHKIPNIILLVGSITGLSFTIISKSLYPVYNPLLGFVFHLGAGLLGFILLEAIVFVIALIINKNAFGMGDSKYLFLLGSWLGLKGMILSLLLAIYIGGSITLILLLIAKIKRGQKIPFGPYLSIGGYLVCLYGEEFWISLIRKISLYG